MVSVAAKRACNQSASRSSWCSSDAPVRQGQMVGQMVEVVAIVRNARETFRVSRSVSIHELTVQGADAVSPQAANT